MNLNQTLHTKVSARCAELESQYNQLIESQRKNKESGNESAEGELAQLS